MRIFNLSAAAEKALAVFPRPITRPAPSFTVRSASGKSVDASTATGAFRALQFFPACDRENARIYDEDGYCMYR